MMRINWIIVFSICTTSVLAQSPVDFVNPFIGTSNFGATNPGAVHPHGMVSVTPFNVAYKKGEGNLFEKDSEWHSRPYVHENNFLTGYSHINLSGVGCPELGSILLMPTSGALELDPENYGTTYYDEKASPGYYSNTLDSYRIQSELTSTIRTGLSKFTFPAGQGNIILNLGLGLTNETGATVKIISPTKIEGHKTIGTFCYNPEDVRPVYFAMELSKTPVNFGTWKKMPPYRNVEAEWISYNNAYKPYESYAYPMSGDNLGAYFSFELEDREEVFVKIAISYVSTENAWKNLKAEQPEFDFGETLAASRLAWNNFLSRISIKSEDVEAKTIFYTALYHTLLHPNIINDVNGDYPLMGFSGVGNSNRNRYSVFSLWDTYRNVHPLLSLVYPEIQSEMVQTMVDMYKESGWLPKWELLGMETDVMVGDPATPVIADTYLRGIRDFDIDLAYEAITKASETAESDNLLRPGIDDYNKLGYVPVDTSDIWGGNVSASLEYYISDWNIGQLANALGKQSDHAHFNQKSMQYQTLFDAETGMLRPKFKDGTWYGPFDPEAGKNFEAVIGFVEGNAWQYRFYVPHDIPGLISKLGGQSAFEKELDILFNTGNYDMANEPDITFPYLYNYVEGAAWKSQQKINDLITNFYHNKPGGIPGNDDTGTLSAWLLFSMLGFYPVCPGDMNYAIISPYFDEVEIKLNKKYYNAEKLIVRTKRQSRSSIYIGSMKLNGKGMQGYFVDHKALTNGKTLEFNLIDNPIHNDK